MTSGQARSKSLIHWALLGSVPLVAAVLLWLSRIEPDPRGFGTHEQLGLASCLPMRLWDVPCPGCGVTTSVALALHGRLWDSFVNQPFGALVAVLLALYLVVVPLAHFRGADLGRWIERPPARWVIAALGLFVLGSWVWKFLQLRS
ncbi:MAG: DUF2752 domain-containing protein [Planctomycetota bacterium]